MIFSKTNLGRAVAFDPHSSLPIREKNLLRLIDGRTPVVALTQSMEASGCSVELFDALLNQDLIRLSTERSGHSSATPGHDDRTIPAQLAPLQAKNPELQAKYAERLAAAKDSIATFVLTYLPARASAVLKDLEDVSNGQQMAATIDAVTNMANRSEAVNPVHTNELRQTVRHLLSD
jgi:hypothetical protein